jgi:hypothetical protein
LTAIAGAIGSVAAIVAALTGIFGSSKKEVPLPLPKVETKALSTLPWTLIKLMGTKDFLQYFTIRVDNESAAPLDLKISFESDERLASVDRTPFKFTIDPHTPFAQDINPELHFLVGPEDVQPNDFLKITWEIDHLNGSPIKAGTEVVHLLAANVFDWNLATPKGPVPRDFLLASLATWVVTADLLVANRSSELLKNTPLRGDPSSIAREWLRKAYTQLFYSRAIHISAASRFPAEDQQVIKTPSQVLKDGDGDPLEAVLLLSALGRQTFRKVGSRSVMFAIPGTGNQGVEQTFLLSWFTGPNWASPQVWHALNPGQPGKSFEENEKQATQQLMQLLGDKPEILDDLRKEGVSVRRAALALDFVGADKHFHMTGQQ